MGLVILAALFAVEAVNAGQTVVFLDGKAVPANAVLNDVQAEGVVHNGRPALRVKFGISDWPSIFFKAESGVWDWSAGEGLAVDVFNPEREPVAFCVRVDNQGADGRNNCNTACAFAQPGQWTTLNLRFRSGRKEKFWGMRGIPGVGPLAEGTTIDLSKIVAFQVFLPRPSKEHTLLISNVRLMGPSDYEISMPFVDRFGQYKHATWPGKLRNERELAERRKKEETALLSPPGLHGLDRFGGWADGPQLEATGWFRTEKLNGKWWLVDPDGRLFFSIGVDCVNFFDRTFVEKREDWFEWLPQAALSPTAEGERERDEFEPAVGYASGVHSMAEVIGGNGRTFNFYVANLIRKYGKDWQVRWREISCARLKAWGFNTIGNWSQHDVLESNCLPFAVNIRIGGDFRRIEGGGGYWEKMPDVFDPKFAEAAESAIEPVAKKFASNRFCIGYFVDNELAWEAIERGTLASPVDQPCRVEMVRRLREKYGSLEALNSAWETDAETWNDLRVPDSPNEVCQKDLDEWVYVFSRRYFDTVKATLRRYAPRQLYLGCRFCWTHKEAIRAAADVVDVVSFNLYKREIDCGEFCGENDLGKPVIIGEFHFGALDRGMFHPGLVPVADQNERAASYVRYVESVLKCPAIVGCHWFQYIDEPITGRVHDGENYNIGLVDVTDTPYPELITAAKSINSRIYQRRMSSGN
ncbi:MAG: beta-galactosidase [Armatimonadetes bacterium]|nr:beta-galactosidase [Armatimonadota bacterium]